MKFPNPFPFLLTSSQRAKKKALKDSRASPIADLDEISSLKIALVSHSDLSLDEKPDELEENVNEYEKMLLPGVAKPSDLQTTFEDVHAPPATIEALRMLTTLSLIRPDAFQYGVLKHNKILGVLLYGPPGTGKTHLAKAVAKESGATMLEISGADVYQQYVGEGEKMVRAVFTLARKLDPCIIFFDEADAIFRTRSEDEKGYHRELINQFLKEWDGLTSGSSKSGFMMVATNRPYDLDEAVLRRLPRQILVDVPTIEDREAILKIYLKDELLGADVDVKSLAVRTPNYTGSDLKNLCVSAAFACVYEETTTATKNTTVSMAEHLSRALTRTEFPEKRTLCARHFDKALSEISSTIDVSSLNKIRNFQKRPPPPERHIELPPPLSKPRFGAGAQSFKTALKSGQPAAKSQ